SVLSLDFSRPLRRIEAVMIDAILNLLFPVSCVLCGSQVVERRRGPACPACWAKLEPLMPPVCPQCGVPAIAIEGLCGACRLGEHAFDYARSALLFNDAFREIIHHFKYSDRVSLAKPLGELLRKCVDRQAFEAQIVIPVPLHPSRERQRGFNQAELLADLLKRQVDARLLRRRKRTPSQTGLSRSRRTLNLAGAFEVRGKVPGCVMIVDDVYTTGATLNEIAKTLKRAGAVRVEALTVARVQR